jgi:hypothetical protein
MKKVASLKYGVVFKKAFCDPEIFTAFAEAVIGRPISIDHVETEKELDPPIGYIKPRFDLFAEDTEHRFIVVIQHARLNDRYDRFFHEHDQLLLDRMVKSGKCRLPLTVYTVVVLTSGDRHQRDIAIVDFDPHDLAGKPLGEVSHKVIYLCPKYVTESTPEPYREWLRAIDDTLDEEVDESRYDQRIIQKLFESIRRDHLSPEERARMIEEYHQEELQQTKFEEGVHEGEKKKAIQIARKLLRTGGLTVQSIAAMTDLSEEEVVALVKDRESL